jgi:hypothetical protein
VEASRSGIVGTLMLRARMVSVAKKVVNTTKASLSIMNNWHRKSKSQKTKNEKKQKID